MYRTPKPSNLYESLRNLLDSLQSKVCKPCSINFIIEHLSLSELRLDVDLRTDMRKTRA